MRFVNVGKNDTWVWYLMILYFDVMILVLDSATWFCVFWGWYLMILYFGMTIILCYVMLCCLIFWAKYQAIYKIYEQNLMIRYALCYALLCWLMISLWKWAKSYALLCSAYDDLKSKILWYVMLVSFVSKILWSYDTLKCWKQWIRCFQRSWSSNWS